MLYLVIALLWGLAAVPLVILLLWWAATNRKRALARFGDPALVARLSQTVNVTGRRVRAVLWTLALGTFVLALARPQFGTRVETGTVFMNRCDYLDPALTWTGVKNTGRGGTLSKIGYENLTRPKSFHLRF